MHPQERQIDLDLGLFLATLLVLSERSCKQAPKCMETHDREICDRLYFSQTISITFSYGNRAVLTFAFKYIGR